MKIGLISPPGWFGISEFASAVVPPLGLAYCAAVLEGEGHDVFLLDAQAEAPFRFKRYDRYYLRGLSPQEIVDRLPFDLDIIGLSHPYSFITPLMDHIITVTKNRFRNIPLVLGGAHPSALPEQVLTHPGVDLIIRGEAEQLIGKVFEILTSTQDNNELRQIRGIAFKEKETIIVTGSPQVVEDVRNLPWPLREKLPMEQYQMANQPHGSPRGKWTTIIASRGCPFNCSFCTSPQLSDNNWRIRDVSSVLQEMFFLHESYGITDFHFEDDNMTIQSSWIEDFCDQLKQNSSPFTWQINVGVSTTNLSPELLGLMKEAGLTNITFAPESGSKRVLREIMGKKNDLRKIKECTHSAFRHDIRVCVFFILGTPGETIDDLRATLRYSHQLAKLGADEVSMSFFAPLPGSFLFQKLYPQPQFAWSDSFFHQLAGQSDLLNPVTWINDIDTKTLLKIRIKGLILFYLFVFLYHPGKLVRFLKNMVMATYETKTEKILAGKIAFLLRKFGRKKS